MFAVGFSLPAATAVCAGDGDVRLDEFEMLDVLDSLVRKSLLNVDRSGTGVRYGLLETIRQFAEEALAAAGASDATRDAHAGYFADQSDAAFVQWTSPNEVLGYRFINAEILNLSAAFRWSVDNGLGDPAVRIAVVAHNLARNRLRTETFGWAEEMISLARETGHRLLPELLSQACDSASGLGRFDEAIQFGLEAIELTDDERYEPSVTAFFKTGFALAMSGDIDRSLSVLRVGSLHPTDRDLRGSLTFLHTLAGIAGVRFPDVETDQAVIQLASARMPTIQATRFWVQALKVAETDAPAAIAFYQQAIDIAVESGCRTVEETCRGFQMGLLADTVDVLTALNVFTDRVKAWQITGDPYAAAGVTALANMLARLGYREGAAQLYGAVSHHAEADIAATMMPLIVTVRDEMGRDAFNAAYQAGGELGPQAAGQLAHQLIAQARADQTNIDT